MAVNFTALEVLEIAEQLERNAAKFYRDASMAAKSKDIQKLFFTLAEMEDKHKKIFAEMLADYQQNTQANIVDPDNEMLFYMNAMAKNAGWEGKAAPKMVFKGNETPAEVLNSALKAEQASIDFYLGIKEFVKSQSDKEKVEQIIKEEMTHVVYLQKNLEQINKL
ncbi:MAG: hypothetical protein A2Y10_11585 [Planctomycetes bacterium GWF2_41_51]|nr:MAG: hypothetical protein A2Y10_11585 [Planctomycetes bacterium GWF2_41_51]